MDASYSVAAVPRLSCLSSSSFFSYFFPSSPIPRPIYVAATTEPNSPENVSPLASAPSLLNRVSATKELGSSRIQRRPL